MNGNDVLILFGFTVGVGLLLLVGWVIRDLKAGADAEYTADLQERLEGYDRDNLPDRNDITGRFEKRD